MSKSNPGLSKDEVLRRTIASVAATIVILFGFYFWRTHFTSVISDEMASMVKATAVLLWVGVVAYLWVRR